MTPPRALVLAAAAAALLTACATTSSTGPMSFFITSAGSGKGGDLGGLAGADALCQRLAAAAGAGGKTWRAYLSTPPSFAAGSPPVAAVHARDRIGTGPWFNAKGQLIARDLNHLHNGNNISKETALDERGNPVADAEVVLACPYGARLTERTDAAGCIPVTALLGDEFAIVEVRTGDNAALVDVHHATGA